MFAKGVIIATGTITAYSQAFCGSATADTTACINDANNVTTSSHLQQGLGMSVGGTYTLPGIMAILSGNQTVYYNIKAGGPTFSPGSIACYAIKIA